MIKTTLAIAACVTVLGANTALALPTHQQNCDKARVTAWKTYTSCVDASVARNYGGAVFDAFAAFAKCRHKYFKNWTSFQTKSSLSGSSCVGSRFTSTSTTVADSLTGLVWQKATGLDSIPNYLVPQDADNQYTWSATFPSNVGTGTVYTSFLGGTSGLNSTTFGGTNDWRLPTFAELQSILLDFPCTGSGNGPTCFCPTSPCIDATFDAANTQHYYYMSATTYVPDTALIWCVDAITGWVDGLGKFTTYAARAVRGGL